ncbi:hypothetical protein [Chitinimonas sp. BJB300]|uniref:hypothetical protein n=1 Tax=Chitinimonas sp. BJB300 TaxID=1559339 RepID=UPI000C10F1DD|nr:hypothetical protein [Chitinimonas sp. BJB300]PHV12170.1 hypothetical protein CSQ89_06870 [Chitinimonas sp. BJB300]TSJ91575.1 hypothetical protein FG002_004715 [Chitinimonas sp. BJB300]
MAQTATLPVAAQLTYNFHADGNSYSNGSTTYHRPPLELVFYYTGVEKWRFGAGLRHAGNAKYKISQDGYSSTTANFKANTGLILEAGYTITPSVWVSGRYVKETYN